MKISFHRAIRLSKSRNYGVIHEGSAVDFPGTRLIGHQERAVNYPHGRLTIGREYSDAGIVVLSCDAYPGCRVQETILAGIF